MWDKIVRIPNSILFINGYEEYYENNVEEGPNGMEGKRRRERRRYVYCKIIMIIKSYMEYMEFYTASPTYLHENIVIVTFPKRLGFHTQRASDELKCAQFSSDFTFSHLCMDGIEYGKINCYFLSFCVLCMCVSCLMQPNTMNEHKYKVVFDELSAFFAYYTISVLFTPPPPPLALSRTLHRMAWENVYATTMWDYFHTINFETP